MRARQNTERADLLRGLLGAVGVHVDRRDRAPAFGERDGGGPADAATRAGDDRDASAEPPHRAEPG